MIHPRYELPFFNGTGAIVFKVPPDREAHGALLTSYGIEMAEASADYRPVLAAEWHLVLYGIEREAAL